MKCPKCGFEQAEGSVECLNCGIFFKKYLAQQQRIHDADAISASFESQEKEGGKNDLKAFLTDILFLVKPGINIFYFAGRVVVFLIIFVWGLKFILTPMGSNYAGRSFLHLVNLPFHEAGHIIFSIFGRFISVLGGSIMQLIIPLICLVVFLIKTQDTFAASVTLWWFGESLMDLAPYINDARKLELMLLGGVTGKDAADYHDWEFILRKLGLLQYDHILASTANFFGTLFMLCAVAWGGFLLFKQFKNIEN